MVFFVPYIKFYALEVQCGKLAVAEAETANGSKCEVSAELKAKMSESGISRLQLLSVWQTDRKMVCLETNSGVSFFFSVSGNSSYEATIVSTSIIIANYVK